MIRLPVLAGRGGRRRGFDVNCLKVLLMSVLICAACRLFRRDGVVSPLALFLLLLAAVAAPARAADVPGSRDYPGISRYAGSEIIRYEVKAFDDYVLVTEPTKGRARQGLELKGQVFRITYRNPPNRTSLEVLENYRTALQGAGASEIFTCANRPCGGRDFNLALVDPQNYTRMGDNYDDQRYLAARLQAPGKDVYVALFITRSQSGAAADKDRIFTQLHVIEVKSMDANMVVVDASRMADSIGKTGSVALYGILFDFNSAVIKPESKATLDEIASLLRKTPDLKLVVVGHTDNVGGMDSNMKLSQARAEAVRRALVEQYAIAAARLQAWGAGFMAPVASNRTDEGRAKNRRVELVEQ